MNIGPPSRSTGEAHRLLQVKREAVQDLERRRDRLAFGANSTDRGMVPCHTFSLLAQEAARKILQGIRGARRPEPTLDNPAVDHPLKARKGTSWVWPFRLPVGKAGSTTLAGRAAPPMIVRSVAAVLVATMTAAKKVHRLTVISSGQTGRSDDGLLVRVDEANLDGHRLADWPPFQLGSADEVAGVARIRFARGPQLHSRKRIGSTGGVLLVSQSQSSTRRCFRHEAGLGGWRHGRSRVGRQSWRHDVTSSDIAVDLHAVDASTEQPLNS